MGKRGAVRVEVLERRALLSIEPLDTTFGSGGNAEFPYFAADSFDQAHSVVAMPDGRSIVAGNSLDAAIELLRLNADGEPDPTFGRNGRVYTKPAGAPYGVVDVLLQADGKIVAISDGPSLAVRFEANGRIDTSFGQAGLVPRDSRVGWVTAGAIDAEGRIAILSAYQLNPNSPRDVGVTRLNPDGSLDTSFGTRGVNGAGLVTVDFGLESIFPRDIEVDAQGRTLVACNRGIARLDANGLLDRTFADGGKLGLAAAEFGATTSIRAIEVVAQDEILVAAESENGEPAAKLARFSAEGQLDRAFANDAIYQVSQSRIWGLVQSPGGELLLGVSRDQGTLIRLTPEGTRDESFAVAGTLANNELLPGIADLVALADNRVVVASSTGTGDFLVSRALPSGVPDPGFGSGGAAIVNFGEPANEDLRRSWSSSDGSLYLLRNGGVLTGQELIRYRADGRIDLSFDYEPIAGTSIMGGHSYADGRTELLLADRQSNRCLQHLLPNGAPDAQFGSAGLAKLDIPAGYIAGVYDIDSQGRVVLALVANAAARVARFLSDGSPDVAFGSGGVAAVSTSVPTGVKVCPDGKIAFLVPEDVGGKTYPALLKLRPDGSLDNGFGTSGKAWIRSPDSGITFPSSVFGVDASGRLIVGGSSGYKDIGISLELVAVQPNGTIDRTFGDDGFVLMPLSKPGQPTASITSLLIRPDQSVVVGGALVQTDIEQQGLAILFDPFGRPVQQFGTQGVAHLGSIDYVNAVLLGPGDTIVVAGERVETQPYAHSTAALARYFVGAALAVRTDELPSTENAAPGYASMGSFTIERSGDLSQPLELPYSLAGTATLGADYWLPADRFVIPAGQASLTIPVHAMDDRFAEGDELVQFTFDRVPDGYRLVSGTVATVTLRDDDAPDRFEPNDSIGTAARIGPTTSLTNLSLHTETDQDYFRVRAEFGGYLHVQLGTGAAPGKPDLELLDSSGVGVSTLSGTAANGSIFKLLIPGDYYIHLKSGPAPSYTLDVRLQRFSTVIGRHVFYKGSIFDASAPRAINSPADNAIAPDKTALQPGESATAANIIGASKGINGLIVDLAGLPAALTHQDLAFRFAKANGGTLAWETIVQPGYEIRANGGVSGADRLELSWPELAGYKNGWMEITIPANPITGLAQAEVFYFGSLVGDTGGAVAVDASDLVRVRNGIGSGLADLSNPRDVNRDGRINASDLVLVRNNVGRALPPRPSGPAAIFANGRLRPITRANARETDKDSATPLPASR